MSIAKQIKQLGSETIIYGISGTLRQFIGVFLAPIYTRIFSPADYGIVALITTSLGFLSTIVVLGLDNASARWYYGNEDVGYRKTVMSGWFWCQLILGIILAIIIVLFAAPISGLLFGNIKYANIIRVAVWLLPLGAFGKVLGNWLRYQRRPTLTATYFTSSSLGTIGLTILFVVFLRKGMLGIYYGQLIAAFLTAVIALIIFWSWISPRHFSWETLKEMLKFGFPLALAGIASWITASSDRLFLQKFYGLTEVGIYAISVTVSSPVGLVIGAFQLAWGPFAFSILNEKDSSQIYGKVFSLYALFGSLLCTGISLFSPLILRLLATPRYFPAVSSVPWLAFSSLAVGATYIAVMGTSIVKKSAPIATSIFIGASLNTVLNVILIPRFGKDGAAAATMLAYSSQVCYLYYTSQKLYHIPYDLKNIFICIVFSGILISIDRLFLPTLGWMGFSIRLFFCLLFIPLAFSLKIIDPKQLLKLVSRNRALK